jgi:hypothetical protein
MNNELKTKDILEGIPLSTVIRLISKMIKISNITVTIPYINPHTNIQDKLELKIKSDNND